MKSLRQRLVWATFLALGVIAVSSAASAQETGILAGKVVAEADGAALPGTTITIEGTDITGVSDRSGNFRLAAVPAGEQTVMATLAGFGEVSESVTVAAGQVTTLNLRLPLTFAGTVEVFGLEYGYRRAVAQQKESDTLVTVVSEETLEYLPDQSIGESLGRLPGVTLQKDRGEAERIYVRGADSRLNAVTVNGDRIPSPESTVAGEWTRGNRSVRLNTMPATLIGEIEVFKAVPANMDADSVGGAVNISTKSAAGLSGQLVDVTIQGGYNDLPERGIFSGELNYGTRLNQAGTWGLIVTASYEENRRGVQGTQAEWDDIDEVLDMETGEDVPLGFDGYVIDDYDIIWRDLTRTREGVTVTLDHQPAASSLFKLGGFWSEFTDEELRRRMQNRPGASADYTTETVFNDDGIVSIGSSDGGRIRRRVRPGVKVQETYNYFLEGSHLFGLAEWEFDWRLSNIYASRSLSRTRARWEARAQDIGLRGDGIADWTYTNGDTDLPDFTFPAWSNDPDVLHIGRRGDYRIRDNDNSEDEIQAAKFDVRKSFGAQGGFELQFGYKGSWRDRTLVNRTFNWDGIRDNPIYMSEALGSDRFTPVQPYGYANGMWADQSIIDQIFIDQPELFEFDGDTTDEDYIIDETIQAAYIMGTLRSDRWTLNAGVRYEDTDTIVTARDGEASHQYDDFYPSVILRFQATDNIVLRGAWTNSIGRPDFTDLRPFFNTEFDYEISDDTGEYEGELTMSGGNPVLDPFESENFDLSFEYYLGSGGVFSAGVFYKDIKNFEYPEEIRLTDVNISELPPYLGEPAREAVDDAREDNPDIPADFDNLTLFWYTRPVNGDVSKIRGFEFNWQQRFVGLPSPLDKFGVFANLTLVDGDSDITGDISRDYLIGQFDEALNFQLFWENRNFSGRLAYNRNGVIYEVFGLDLEDGVVVSDEINDRFRDVENTFDAAFQWYVNSHFTLLFDVRNITDTDSVRRVFGNDNTINRFVELENGGRVFVLGLRYRL